MESTGNQWVNLYEAMEGNGISVVLANPLKMKAIASAKIKSDKVDARTLACLSRGDSAHHSFVSFNSFIKT